MNDAKFVTKLPEGEQCVAMCVFKDTIFVATTAGVYFLRESKLVPVLFATTGAKNA